MKPLFPDVIVDGETIASADIAAEAQNHMAPKGKPGLAWRAAARALVVRKLLLNAAKASNITPDPQFLAKDKLETDSEAKIRAYLDENLKAAPVSDADCKSMFEATPNQFCAPDLFEASHILIAAIPDDAEKRKAAQAVAENLLQAVKDIPKDFGRLAMQHSDCSSGQNRGQLGQLGSGDTVPEFEAAIKQMKNSEVYPHPLETRYGFHVLRLDNMAKGKPLPYETVKPSIREALEKSAWANGANELVSKLVSNAVIIGIDLRPAP